MIDRHLREDYVFTSESVTEGHPDKLSDRIADAILDDIIAQDSSARVAVEVLVATGLVICTGQITTSAYSEIPKIAREAINSVGYTRAKYGFDGATVGVLTAIDEQSPDIARGVDRALEAREKGDVFDDPLLMLGAGDQGIMFGYACRESETYMPLPISLAHALCKRLAVARKERLLAFLRPDGKSQVSVRYANGKPVHIDTILVSCQHSPDVSQTEIKDGVLEVVIKKVIPQDLMDRNTRVLINPTGRFEIGGPQADTGLSGRKIIVDTYGGYCRHGGGSFSGKDPTKVDRSGSYYCRYIAKHLVAAGYCDEVEVQLSYAIGVAEPTSFDLETFGTHKVPLQKLVNLVRRHFDARPGSIIRQLDLRRPIYTPLSAYGHFGRDDLDLSWERLDRVNELLDDLPL
ncbi:MAG: methionine adenosyltransferase [bacterium JZ-2024 1]